MKTNLTSNINILILMLSQGTADPDNILHKHQLLSRRPTKTNEILMARHQHDHDFYLLWMTTLTSTYRLECRGHCTWRHLGHKIRCPANVTFPAVVHAVLDFNSYYIFKNAMSNEFVALQYGFICPE